MCSHCITVNFPGYIYMIKIIYFAIIYPNVCMSGCALSVSPYSNERNITTEVLLSENKPKLILMMWHLSIYFFSYKESFSSFKARVRHYLLEKSRVTSWLPGEQNFNIFYHLLNGMSGYQMQSFGLYGYENYR